MCHIENTARCIVYPLLRILQIFGLNRCVIETGQRCPYRTCYLFGVLSFLIIQYLKNTVDFIVNRKIDQVEFLKIITASILFGSETLGAVCSIFVSYSRSKEIFEVIGKLLKIDKIWLSIGVRAQYSRNRSYTRSMQFLIFLFCCMSLDFIIFYVYEPHKVRTIIMMRYSARIVSWTNAWYFLVVLSIIRNHFKKVNDELETMAVMVAKNLFFQDVVFRVQMLHKIHNLSRKISRLHNSLFGAHINFLTLFFMSITTSYLYFLFVKNIRHFNHTDKGTPIGASYVYLCVWIIVYFTLCYNILQSIQSTVEEVRFVCLVLFVFVSFQ